MNRLSQKQWPNWAEKNQTIKEIFLTDKPNIVKVNHYGDIYDFRWLATGEVLGISTLDQAAAIAATKEEADPTGKDPHQPGAKLDAGKLRMNLVLSAFSRALQEVSAIGTFGANKYTANGWLEVPDGIERYSDAMLRHYFKETTEGPMDPDMNLLHAAAVAWNSLARLELMLRKEESC